jgi:hypothetical protein
MVQSFIRPKAHRVKSSISAIRSKPSATIGFSYVELVTPGEGSKVGSVVGGIDGGVGVGMAVGAAVGGIGVGLDGVTVLMVMWGVGVAVNRTAALVGAEVSVGDNGGVAQANPVMPNSTSIKIQDNVRL